MARTPVASTKVERIERQRREHTRDLVAVEEPLQMLLEHGEAHARTEAPLAMTMRTPGNDSDLVTGFLYAEGVIAGIDGLISVRHCAQSDTPENVVRAVLDERVVVPPRLLERNLTVTSACSPCRGSVVSTCCHPKRSGLTGGVAGLVSSYRRHTRRGALRQRRGTLNAP